MAEWNTSGQPLEYVLSRSPGEVAEIARTPGVPLHTDDRPLLEFRTVPGIGEPSAGQVKASSRPTSAGCFSRALTQSTAIAFGVAGQLSSSLRTPSPSKSVAKRWAKIPFLTELRGESGITFEGSFRVEAADLDVAGTVDLTTLDEGLRGHAGLDLTLRHGGEVLGRGSLLPGHFATLDEGYRVGFTGLEKWSEVDVVRRNDGHVVVVGASGALLGALFWPLASWRRW